MTNKTNIFILPTSDGMMMINMNTIVRIQSISNYSKLFFDNGRTLVVAKVLAWFDDILPKQWFIRAHRSHLVNLRYVKEFLNSDTGGLILKDDTVITISRRRRRTVSRYKC